MWRMSARTVSNEPRRTDLRGQDAEPRFDHVQPRGPGGREVKVHPGMGRQLAAAPVAFRVGVWQIMSWGQGRGARRSPPEGLVLAILQIWRR
jgi:hypothetical protein